MSSDIYAVVIILIVALDAEYRNIDMKLNIDPTIHETEVAQRHLKNHIATNQIKESRRVYTSLMCDGGIISARVSTELIEAKLLGNNPPYSFSFVTFTKTGEDANWLILNSWFRQSDKFWLQLEMNFSKWPISILDLGWISDNCHQLRSIYTALRREGCVDGANFLRECREGPFKEFIKSFLKEGEPGIDARFARSFKIPSNEKD
ncbi:hypothetical protein COB55_00060 [Candidatus Wolfebacteria bacterium]|nr:MAG: hypothetical protein COB55_00060 [Candidatus Wolfebacteria bacterium]